MNFEKLDTSQQDPRSRLESALSHINPETYEQDVALTDYILKNRELNSALRRVQKEHWDLSDAVFSGRADERVRKQYADSIAQLDGIMGAIDDLHVNNRELENRYLDRMIAHDPEVWSTIEMSRTFESEQGGAIDADVAEYANEYFGTDEQIDLLKAKLRVMKEDGASDEDVLAFEETNITPVVAKNMRLRYPQPEDTPQWIEARNKFFNQVLARLPDRVPTGFRFNQLHIKY